MRIGFTGTQRGMTNLQKEEVEFILVFHYYSPDGISSIHHGGCAGADEEFHTMCFRFGSISCIPIIHPASNTEVHPIARLNPPDGIYLQARPALVRNRNIVDSVDIMIATPKQDYPVLRSGTWATIRYAKKRGKIIHVIYPGGE